MKKIVFAIALLAIASVAVADIKAVQGYGDTATYLQFTHVEESNTGDYHDGLRPSQNWLGAQTIYLYIPSEADVYFSNYVNSWYGDVDDLNGNVYQMGAGQYGAFEIDGDKKWVGNGESRLVTYSDAASGLTKTTEAYYVGHFNGGEKVALYMTTLPTDGGEMVDSWQYVYDGDHLGTTLYSRVDGTHDLAGNVRINYGLTTYPDGREFVAFGASEYDAPSGQPLPSAMASVIIAAGSVFCAKKMKKNRK